VSAQLLLREFERLGDAPDAIPTVRRFLLRLAVQGRLVPRDPADGDAAKFIQRVRVDRDPPTEAFGDLRIPSHWAWTRVRDIGRVVGGGTPPSGDAESFASPGEGFGWLTPADLGQQRLAVHVSRGRRDITARGLACSAATLMPAGTVLFTSRAPIGYVAIAATELATNQGFKSVVPSEAVTAEYLALYFRAFAPIIDSMAPGTTFREVSGRIVGSLPFPLPPLGEQHRIVATLQELMTLCDELDAAQIECESRRDRLRSTALRALVATQSPAPEASARFFLASLSRVVTKPDHVVGVRQAILDLAVEGRLVTQRQTDTPARTMLVEADKTRAKISHSDRRAAPQQQPLLAADLRWDIPAGWEWRGLADLVLFIDYRGRTPTKTTSGIRLVTAKNVRPGRLSPQPEEFISPDEYTRWMTRGFPRTGDVLFTTEAPMGNAAVVRDEEPFALAQRVIDLRSYGAIEPDFLAIQLAAAPFQAVLNATATGLTAKGIKAAKLKRLPIAVPPLEEQRRIVAKVDELMGVCEQMELRLTDVLRLRTSLLEAAVRDASRAVTEELVDAV
jgi:type I restriction enzyme S subunit